METPYKVLTTFDTHVATAKAGTFVVVQDEVAYVAGGLGLAIIDVSAPQSPKLITVVNTGVATRDYGGAVAVDGGLAYFVGNLGTTSRARPLPVHSPSQRAHGWAQRAPEHARSRSRRTSWQGWRSSTSPPSSPSSSPLPRRASSRQRAARTSPSPRASRTWRAR
jgi:hypothetical protein